MGSFVVAAVLLLFAGWANYPGVLFLVASESALFVSALTPVEWLVMERQLAPRRLPLAVLGVWLINMAGSVAMVLHVSLVSELSHGLTFAQSRHNVLYLAKMSPSQNLLMPVVCAGALSIAFSVRVLSASTERLPLRELLRGEGARVALTPLVAGFFFSVVVAGVDESRHAFIASTLAAIAYLLVLAPMIVIAGGTLLVGYRLVDRLLPATEPGL